MKEKRNSIISNIIWILILIIAIFLFYKFYSKYNFNDYSKSEYRAKLSQFTRDSSVKYSKMNSYKIDSKEYNDAMFYKTIQVTPNTPYKVTCMVKTQNVTTESEFSNGGAHISISDTTEKSKSIKGTSEWQKVEFIFNSKAREEVNVGFRLGGFDDNCTGTAWFSDFTIESGVAENDTQWNFGLFIIDNVDININNEKVQISMTQEDKELMLQDIERFKNSIKTLSNNNMSANITTYEIKAPLTSMSYDDENGYYVSPKDVENLIDSYVKEKNLDHIFIALRMGDIMNKTEIPVNDWIGLGYMDYYGIGFSNIRLPNNSKSYIYRYDASINTFPEEVFVHEFLHSLERNLNERNYKIPALHDYQKYGYTNERKEGQKKWYEAYMQKNIETSNGKIGLDNIVYKLKPTKESCFNYSYKINTFDEPKNIIEEMKILVKNIFRK